MNRQTIRVRPEEKFALPKTEAQVLERLFFETEPGPQPTDFALEGSRAVFDPLVGWVIQRRRDGEWQDYYRPPRKSYRGKRPRRAPVPVQSEGRDYTVFDRTTGARLWTVTGDAYHAAGEICRLVERSGGNLGDIYVR
ncbi:hypothetical protein IZ6_25320 [Terrihabitans soli]|uniref:Uncharacterized protein n=1 Tax=Terrihabitans soli TaxID=708113 RepID=A0A6S6QV48_9HYPH|nr:hypothetical protein [Terrihabitans soli]BCJ91797.1 hypothetical protein IZ6_25320 [Terrihabitans soli]